MDDIILDDLIRWVSDRLRPIASESDPRLRSRPISWAVTIRPTSPVLPQLRGDELIVVPASVLDELREMEDVSWDDLIDLLQTRPVAAVLTDRDPAHLPAGFAVLLADAAFVESAETVLNREVTERRTALYRLGSDLARALTSASMAGAGLDQFLNAAESVSGQPLALLTASGTALARSESFPADIDIDPGADTLEPTIEADRVQAGPGDWLLTDVESNALPPGVVLVVGIEPGASGERARLVLREVGQALGLLFDRLPPLMAPTIQRERESLIRDLLCGIVMPGSRRWRRLLPELDHEDALRIGLSLAPCSLTGIGPGLYTAMLDDGRQVMLFPESRVDQIAARVKNGDLPLLIVSAPLEFGEELSAAFRLVEAAARLAGDGALAGNLIDLGDPESGGVPGLVLALVSPDWLDAPGSRRLGAYADSLLAALDAYDAERGGALVESLAAYLDAGTSVTGAAERLGVHRNTLAYRLSRIREIGGYDLDDPALRLSLHLAVVIRRTLDALFPDRDDEST